MYHGYIYKITNKINGYAYIGKTNNLDRRWHEHLSGYGCTTILSKAIRKYGATNFLCECLEEIICFDLKDLNNKLNYLEKHYIKKYNTYKHGYNCTLGGDGLCGFKVSETTKKKISKTLLGHKETYETRKKKSLNRLGKRMSPKSIEKCKKAFRSRSEEEENYRKQRIRETIKGKVRPINVVEKIAVKHRKAVLQYSIDGTFIREYKSLTETGYNISNISACCNGKSKFSHGYIWKWKNNNLNLKKGDNNA